MTDDQFKQYITVQVAQLAALEGILSCLQAIAVKQGVHGGQNWTRVADYLKQSEALLTKG